VFLFSGNGTFKKSFGSYGSGDGQLKAPYGICCDKFGNIFVADHYNDRISLYSKDGEFICHILTKEDEHIP
jgi:sugar lactone lactonase YvrE